MQALLHEAGVYPGAPGSSADAFPVDPVKWEYFKNWFLKALNVLLHVSRALLGQQLTLHAPLYRRTKGGHHWWIAMLSCQDNCECHPYSMHRSIILIWAAAQGKHCSLAHVPRCEGMLAGLVLERVLSAC